MNLISRGAFMAVRKAAEACQGLFVWVEAPGCGLGQQVLTSLSLQKCSVNSILLIISVCLSVLLVSCFHLPSSLSPSFSLSLSLSLSPTSFFFLPSFLLSLLLCSTLLGPCLALVPAQTFQTLADPPPPPPGCSECGRAHAEPGRCWPRCHGDTGSCWGRWCHRCWAFRWGADGGGPPWARQHHAAPTHLHRHPEAHQRHLQLPCHNLPLCSHGQCRGQPRPTQLAGALHCSVSAVGGRGGPEGRRGGHPWADPQPPECSGPCCQSCWRWVHLLEDGIGKSVFDMWEDGVEMGEKGCLPHVDTQ